LQDNIITILRAGESEMSAIQPKYKRVLLKLSGEALNKGGDGGILNGNVVRRICESVKRCADMGVQVSIVVGAGNIWRGRMGADMDSARADHMGMLATAINSLALADALERLGVQTRVMTAIEMKEFAEPYIRLRAIHHLELGRVTIFACGLGMPYFSTDTAAVMRAKEIDADVVLIAKNGVEYVYSADPGIAPDAVCYKGKLDYSNLVIRKLKVIDPTAAVFAAENHIKLHVFGMDDPENICRAVAGEPIGTIITDDPATVCNEVNPTV